MKKILLKNQAIVGKYKNPPQGRIFVECKFSALYYNIYSRMISFNKSKFISQVSRVAVYVVFFWIILLLVRSVWQNITLKQSIQKLNEQIATLEDNKSNLNNLLIYYRSDSFKELEARKKLGMKKPGEKVVILPIEPSETNSPAVAGEQTATPSNFPEEVQKEQKTISSNKEENPLPNWRLWWDYFRK